MLESHIILAAGWIIFCILHSVLASSWFKKYLQRRMRNHSKFYRLYYTLFSFLGFATIIFYLLIIPSYRMFRANVITMIIGGSISAFGALVVITCISKYFFQLSGLKTLIQERKSNELMTTGFHKYVRHPLYTGTFIFIWGLWILIPSLALMITDITITVYTLIGVGFEEKKLVNEFGDAYKNYQQEVPMIIPKF
jgi:protein-S-isoprenylcysteine O-methyltransferase Ste14